MAAIGELSAIITCVNTSARLSKAIIEIAVRYQDARKQIDAFGKEVQVLGQVLSQLYRFLEGHLDNVDSGVLGVTEQILEECIVLFSEVDSFNDKLYSKEAGSQDPNGRVTLRGKTRWVFEAAELRMLRAQVDSMKINVLLMMTLQCLQKRPSPQDSNHDEGEIRFRSLVAQSNSCTERLETVEKRLSRLCLEDMHQSELRSSVALSDSAASIRSARDSILSLYERDSYIQRIWQPREGSFVTASDAALEEPSVSLTAPGCSEREPETEDHEFKAPESNQPATIRPETALSIPRKGSPREEDSTIAIVYEDSKPYDQAQFVKLSEIIGHSIRELLSLTIEAVPPEDRATTRENPARYVDDFDEGQGYSTFLRHVMTECPDLACNERPKSKIMHRRRYSVDRAKRAFQGTLRRAVSLHDNSEASFSIWLAYDHLQRRKVRRIRPAEHPVHVLKSTRDLNPRLYIKKTICTDDNECNTRL